VCRLGFPELLCVVAQDDLITAGLLNLQFTVAATIAQRPPGWLAGHCPTGSELCDLKKPYWLRVSWRSVERGAACGTSTTERCLLYSADRRFNLADESVGDQEGFCHDPLSGEGVNSERREVVTECHFGLRLNPPNDRAIGSISGRPVNVEENG
jgi:hypothetical protein